MRDESSDAPAVSLWPRDEKDEKGSQRLTREMRVDSSDATVIWSPYKFDLAMSAAPHVDADGSSGATEENPSMPG